MPEPGEIQRGLIGSWRLMTGRPDGIRLLDLSADGFWDSFFAIALAVPALAAGWISIANDYGLEQGGARVFLLLRLAAIDIASWTLPLAGLALVAKQAGIADRFVHYVVATNWGSAVIVWLMLPLTLLQIALGDSEAAISVSLLIFAGQQILLWRLTNASLGKGAAVASAVFAGMFVASVVVLFTMQAALGVSLPPQVSG